MNLRQLEFWVPTLLVTVVLAITLSWMSREGGHIQADVAHFGAGYNYVANYFMPKLLVPILYYLGFLAIVFFIYPRTYAQRKFSEFAGAIFVLAVVLLVLFAFVAAMKEPRGVSLDEYGDRRAANFLYLANQGFAYTFGFLICMALYLFLRDWLLPGFFSKPHQNPRAQTFIQQFQVFLFLWIPAIISIFFVYSGAFAFMVFVAFAALPAAFFLHILNFLWLLPLRERLHWRWWKYVPVYLLLVIAATTPFTLLFCGMLGSVSFSPGELVAASWLWLFILVTPFTLILYRFTRKATGSLDQLRSALSSSNASLDFLKSQINPHFLFNALNTLYGTAITEDSDRTAKGIQQLGDMMRFMLHENVQDSIPLYKEIQYLRNYVDLQKLRTYSSDMIRIDTHLDETACHHDIAPMLLIPFVENAFKHGISLRRPSWIKVSLTCTPERLYFDVYNSVHEVQDHNPEADNSGIGLENVRQRLALLYPKAHELTIRQSRTEYFVHLTIEFKS